MSENRSALPAGHQLHWYRIRSVLGQGGFGITYLAEDTNLNQQVAIKEFLPVELALRAQDASVQPITGEGGEQYRWGLERFIAEAQTLARFKHPHIVRVFTVFSANNSAYMVMEYEQGVPLSEKLKGQKSLSQAELESIAFPIMDGLQAVHAQGFIHRDIKPANIVIRADGTPVLLDFGSARQALVGMTRTLTAMVSPGFAPFEQYTAKGEKQGPWTDIYGLGATMYRAATGKSPTDAMDRSEALLHAGKDIFVPAREFAPPGYSPAFLTAIDRALRFRPEERPQTLAQWRQEFTAEFSAHAAEALTESASAGQVSLMHGETVRIILTPTSSPAAAPAMALPHSRVPWLWTMAGAAVLMLLLLVIGKDRRPVTQTVPPLAGSAPAETKFDPSTTVPIDNSEEIPFGEPVGSGQTPTKIGLDPVALTPKSAKKAPESVRNAADSKASWADKRPGDPIIPEPTRSALESQDQQVPAPAVPARQTVSAARSATPTLFEPEENAEISAIKDQLQGEPRDRKALLKREIWLQRAHDRLREAIQAQDYPRAEAYINELLLLTPDNPRLREALAAIREKQPTTRDRKP